MKRRIINIDKTKCLGCGACAAICHEGAIVMVENKAQLLREDYCNGMGNCIPVCPACAISFEERETQEYNSQSMTTFTPNRNCISNDIESITKIMREFKRESKPHTGNAATDDVAPVKPEKNAPSSELRQWPCQLRLAPVTASYLHKAKLLIAADCSAYAYANMHQKFMHGKITLVGCPKLDSVDYSEKLTEIIRDNEIKSVTVIRMEIPCCVGLELAVRKAMQQSGKCIPWQVVSLSLDGKIVDN